MNEIETSQKISFYKMHGLGNDFVIIDERAQELPMITPDLIRRICDRRFGIGCDQLILLSNSEIADVYMTIYNSDGSEASACGNGTRCVATFLNQTEAKIETAHIVLNAWVRPDKRVVVNMGKPKIGQELVEIDPSLPPGILVDLGNPHIVFFIDNVEEFPIEEYGPIVEKHAKFLGGINAEFVTKLSDKKIRMRVWERGAGVTMACGSGACAAAIAGIHAKILPKHPISVILDGGELLISWENDGTVVQTGPAVHSFKGEYFLEL